MRASTVNRRFRLLALLLGVVAGLGVAEIGLRLAGPPESEVELLADLATRFPGGVLVGLFAASRSFAALVRSD